jgi:hypothetical protein
LSPEDASQFVHLFQSELPELPHHLLKDEDDLLCPITYQKMKDPVATVGGNTYERGAIEEWFELHDTDPVTNVVLGDKTLRSNPDFAAVLSTLDVTSLQRYFPKSAAFLNQRGMLKITKVNDSEVLNVFDLIQKIQDCDVPATIQGLQKKSKHVHKHGNILVFRCEIL